MKSLTLLLLIFFTSCAELDFFARRSFEQQMDHNDDPMFMPGEDFPVMAGDSGRQFRTREEIIARTPPSEHQLAQKSEDESLEQELDRRRNALPEKEREHFVQTEEGFENIYQKLYYLRLKHGERKQFKLSKRAPASVDLQLGMSKSRVRSYWGAPVKVEISGHPREENERWTYYREGKLQYIYFEGGDLQGWNL